MSFKVVPNTGQIVIWSCMKIPPHKGTKAKQKKMLEQ